MNQPPVDSICVEADAHTQFLESCLKACHLAADHSDRALLPGMLEAERQETYQREGIPLAVETCQRLEGIAASLGVSVPWPTVGNR